MLLLRKRMLCFEPSLPKKNKQQIKTFKNALLQLGVAVGFVLPPMLVPNSEDINQVGSDLQMMFYLVAGLTSILLVLMAICKRWQQQLFAIKSIGFGFLQSSRIGRRRRRLRHRRSHSAWRAWSRSRSASCNR